MPRSIGRLRLLSVLIIGIITIIFSACGTTTEDPGPVITPPTGPDAVVGADGEVTQEVTEGICDPVCEDGFDCIEGTCVDSAEQCDPACEDGFSCVDGACVEDVLECDPACEDGFSCVDGECIEDVLECDPACEEGFLCVDGECVEDTLECDPACEDGFDCVAGECVEKVLTPCETYCSLAMANCTGSNELFADDDECLTACDAWASNPDYEPGDGGDSIECRTYHAGDPAAEDPEAHCPHASIEGGEVCFTDPCDNLPDWHPDCSLCNPNPCNSAPSVECGGGDPGIATTYNPEGVCTENDDAPGGYECAYEVLNAQNCDDDDACYDDFCTPGIGCSNIYNGACDVDPCTLCQEGDTWVDCAAGVDGTPKSQISVEQGGCNDGLGCTEDVCKVIPAGGGAVTFECSNGPLNCDDADGCTVDSCDPDSDPETNPTWPCVSVKEDENCFSCFKDSECDDNNPCTLNQCDDSDTFTCDFSDTVDCDDGNPCTNDVCLDQVVNINNCDEYDDQFGDNVLCNQVWQAGGSIDPGCYGIQITPCLPNGCSEDFECDDGNVCTQDSCNTLDKVCEYTDYECDDGNPCTLNTCDPNANDGQGKCQWPAATCEDLNPCTDDTCNVTTGCEHTEKNCNDGNPNTNDFCFPATGACLHKEKECDDGDPCTDDYVDPVTGLCSGELPGECGFGGADCVSDDDCPEGISCNGAGSPPKDCDDGNPCTEDVCYDLTGSCVHLVVDCDEQPLSYQLENPPGSGESDPAGDNACRTNVCDPEIGCSYEGITVEQDDSLCSESFCIPNNCEKNEDGSYVVQYPHAQGVSPSSCLENYVNACGPPSHVCGEIIDVVETCSIEDYPVYTCKAVACDDATGLCEVAGQKIAVSVEEGGCDDGNQCTQNKCNVSDNTCDNPPVICQDDGDPCTDDICSPEVGCEHVDLTTDLGPCFVTTCDASEGGTVSYTAKVEIDVAEGGCRDYHSNGVQNYCTLDTCVEVDTDDDGVADVGECVWENPCSDGDACTVDICAEGEGLGEYDCGVPECVTDADCPAQFYFDGGDGVTDLTCNNNGLCVPQADAWSDIVDAGDYPAVSCESDDDGCTIDVCDTDFGGCYRPKTCDDGNACTGTSYETCAPNIESIEAGNPTTITTADTHQLQTGDIVTIANSDAVTGEIPGICAGIEEEPEAPVACTSDDDCDEGVTCGTDAQDCAEDACFCQVEAPPAAPDVACTPDLLCEDGSDCEGYEAPGTLNGDWRVTTLNSTQFLIGVEVTDIGSGVATVTDGPVQAAVSPGNPTEIFPGIDHTFGGGDSITIVGTSATVLVDEGLCADNSSCITDEDCTDGKPCIGTEFGELNGEWVIAQVLGDGTLLVAADVLSVDGGSCGDGSACLTDGECAEVILAGACEGTGDECFTDEGCEEGFACAGVITGTPCKAGATVYGKSVADQVCETTHGIDSCDPDTADGCVFDYACDDFDECTTDSCDPDVGCSSTEPAQCDDGDNACVTIQCDPVSGECEQTDEIVCDDGNACTNDLCAQVEINNVNCLSFVCGTDQNDIPITCPDGVALCNFVSANGNVPPGQCLYVDQTATLCEVNDLCTNAVCNPLDGTCETSPVECDDGNACSTEQCFPGSGCVYNLEVCEDFDACTIDTCNAIEDMGVCGDSLQECMTDDDCLEVSGTCGNADADGEAISCLSDDDCAEIPGLCAETDLPCSSNEDCLLEGDVQVDCIGYVEASICDGAAFNASCVGYQPAGCINEINTCDDGNACTDQQCDPTFGDCLYTPVVCDGQEGQPGYTVCNVVTCDPQVGCEAINFCDDRNACTIDLCDDGDLDGDGNPACYNDQQIECNDGDICTTDLCNAQDGCLTQPKCFDGSDCTVEQCDAVSGLCTVIDKDCDDTNPCTLDLCALIDIEGTCEDSVAPCVIDEDCGEEGVCVGGTPAGACRHDEVDCEYDDPCFAASCDPDIGICDQGSTCDDGNPCTLDSCNPLLQDPTDPTKPLCLNVALPCDDANACTVDSCDLESGTCVFTQLTEEDCDDGEFCTVDYCDFIAGGCVHETNLCDDANPCTLDSCEAADCKHVVNAYDENCVAPCQTSGDCDDGDVCTVDLCDPDLGICINDAKACDDANACTLDGCDKETGQCYYEDINCGGDDDKCTIDSCKPDIGCSYVPKECETANNCQAGTCDPSTGACLYEEITCDDSSVCTTDSCDPNTGQCQFVGPDCNDDSVCTVDYCSEESGQCVNDPLDCEGSDACATAYCDPQEGCVTTAQIDCPPEGTEIDPCLIYLCDTDIGCTSEPVCDDQDPCTLDVCNPDDIGANGLPGCTSISDPCDDDDPCTFDYCDADVGCKNDQISTCGIPCTSDIECADGNECTGEKCAKDAQGNGTCLIGLSADANDNEPCTFDQCVPGIGPVHTLIEGCGQVCTVDADCSETGICNLVYCSPTLGICKEEGIDCDDNDPCTTDQCDEAANPAGCQHTLIDNTESGGSECYAQECDNVDDDCGNWLTDISGGGDAAGGEAGEGGGFPGGEGGGEGDPGGAPPGGAGGGGGGFGDAFGGDQASCVELVCIGENELNDDGIKSGTCTLLTGGCDDFNPCTKDTCSQDGSTCIYENVVGCVCEPTCPITYECGLNGCGEYIGTALSGCTSVAVDVTTGDCLPVGDTPYQCDQNHQCVPCAPECTGLECGNDGCGGVCGDCSELYGEDFFCGGDGICVEQEQTPCQTNEDCQGGMECGEEGQNCLVEECFCVFSGGGFGGGGGGGAGDGGGGFGGFGDGGGGGGGQ